MIGLFDQQVPISWARRQAAGAVAHGVSLDGLFDSALIRPRYGDDRDCITPLQLTLFQAVMVLETNDSTHLMMKQPLEPQTGPLGFRILFGSASLGDGLAAVAHFFQMASRFIRMRLSTEGAYAVLSIRADDDSDGGMLQEDIQLVYQYLGLTTFLGRSFPVSWMTTRDPNHINLGKRHYAIKAPVRLGGCAGLAFPRQLLQLPPPNRRPEEYFWQPIHDALVLLERPQSMIPGPSSASNRSLQASKLAAEQHLAPSTLRRRMAREGRSFRKLREEAILAEVFERLKEPAWCVEAIAADLGYADARSLRRFVKQATGRTPSEWRKELMTTVPPERIYAKFSETVGAMEQQGHPLLRVGCQDSP